MNRHLQSNWLSLEHSLKRLSSGLRVDQAADDAAGLSIAARLQACVRGYQQANRNIQDASSLLSTAEGGLGSIQNDLQRLRLLSVVAANDTLTLQDRAALQAEADKIRNGINQTAVGTEFNAMPVLRGKFDLGSPYEHTDAAFARGRTHTSSITPSIQTHASSAVSSSFSNRSRQVDTYNTDETLPGWSADDSVIEAHSSRDNQNYRYDSTGSTGTLSAGAYDRDTVRMIGGKRYELTTYRLGADGTPIHDGTYLSVDGAAPQAILGLTGNGSQATFAHDGTRIAFTAGTTFAISFPGSTADPDYNVYVANFDANTLSVAARTLVNQDGDTLDVPTTYALGNPPAEWYTRAGDGQKSLKVYARSATGASWEIAEDATNGFTVSADQASITLNGTSRIDSNDTLSVYYHTDYGVVTNTDDQVQIKPALPYEVYGLGTPGASVVLERGSTDIPYDPTHADGFDFDPGTGLFTVYGNSRPAADEVLTVYYQTDRSGGGATASDENGVVDVKLTSRPETYNLTTADPNKAMRVYVAGTEVAYDSSDGYTYDTATNTVSLHGNSRPAAKESVRIEYYQDSPFATDQDGELQVQLSVPPDLYHLADAGGSRALRIYVGGAEVPYHATDGYTYDPASRTVTFHGTARPDVSADIQTRIVSDGSPDGDFTLTLSAPAADYSPSGGSTVVTKDGTALSQLTVTDGTGDGYYLEGGNVHLVGSGAPDGSTIGTTSYAVHYVTTEDNRFVLDTEATATTSDCPEHYIPPLRSQIVDEATLSVVVDGVALTADPVNGYTISKRTGPFMAGTQTYQDYAVTLNGSSRLVGSGHTVEIGFDVSYFVPQIREFSFQVGASGDAAHVVGIPPVGLDELNLNDFCLLSASQASTGIQKADAALATISGYRSNIGAQLNAMSHQLDNVRIMEESNAQAESRIRDLDMAKEVTSLARSQILVQSGTSLMAQANQNAKALMSLLFNPR